MEHQKLRPLLHVQHPLQYSTWRSISIICIYFGKNIKFNRFVVQKWQFFDSPLLIRAILVFQSIKLNIFVLKRVHFSLMTNILLFILYIKCFCSPCILFFVWSYFTSSICGFKYQPKFSQRIEMDHQAIYFFMIDCPCTSSIFGCSFQISTKVQSKIEMDRQAIYLSYDWLSLSRHYLPLPADHLPFK